MTIKTSLVSLLLGTAIAVSATAQETTSVDPATLDLGPRMAMSYANLANEYFEEMLAPEQMLRLFIVAKQQVVATACDGFALDEARLNAALNAIISTQPRNEDATFNYLIFGRIMHGYGIIKGGEMALATYDPDAYCVYGTDITAELSGSEQEGLLVLSASE
ncbi:MAG TPA: hypothetical protein VJ906_03660 [Roseovarius sp.]|nr:hypothetical protein [Roseovarius sp.]